MNRVDYQLIDISEDGFVCFRHTHFASSLLLCFSLGMFEFINLYFVLITG